MVILLMRLRIAVREVAQFLEVESTIELVYLVCFDPETEAVYRISLRSYRL